MNTYSVWRLCLKKMKAAGLKLSPSKCHLFKKQIKYLGHIISEDGIAVNPDKISCVKDWPIPKTVSEVQRFVGFTSVYRRFVKDFAKIARPLHLVTQGGVHYQTKTKTKVRYYNGDQNNKKHLICLSRLVAALLSLDLLITPSPLLYTQMQV